MDNFEKRRINRQIRGAQAWVIWGLFGILLPLLGIIFAAIAIHKTRIIEEDYDINFGQDAKLIDIRKQAYAIIVVSLLSGLTWYFVSQQL